MRQSLLPEIFWNIPQYSRPEEWHGQKVPPVLLSGHHANIEAWRREQSIMRTAKRRPDLLEKGRPDQQRMESGTSVEERVESRRK